MLPNTQRRKNLVVVRAGDASLHARWLQPAERSYDVFVSYYGKTPGTHESTADAYEHRPGPKWPCIAELLAKHPGLVDAYDAFWFPDDDLEIDAAMLERLFALFHGLALELAQPALTRDSYFTWDFLLQREECLLRYSSFIEVMCPVFSRAMLKRCLPSFSSSRSGWGLDWLWPELCPTERRADGIAIIDATPVRHTRPLGGNLYTNNPDMQPRRDESQLLREHGLEHRRVTGKYGAVLSLVGKRPLPWRDRIALQLRLWNALRREARARRRGRSLTSET